ncbi:MAG TPA: hypothetical protein VF263_26300, partial [Longimicrobiaceae bacterium]
MSAARLLALLAVALCGAGALSAQAVAAAPTFVSAARPDTVTVGDRFLAVVRVSVPPDARVVLSVRPVGGSDVQSVGPAINRSSPISRDLAVAYPMVAWRPGALAAPYAVARVTYGNGRVRDLRVPLRVPFVRSVLPADTAGVEPRGPKDVIGRRWDPRLALIALAAVLGLLLLWVAVSRLVRWIRRRRAPEPVDPRARALAALDLARPLVERGEWRALHTRTSGALREYLGALSPRWGADLTTWEVVRALEEDRVDADEASRLEALLREADRV